MFKSIKSLFRKCRERRLRKWICRNTNPGSCQFDQMYAERIFNFIQNGSDSGDKKE